MQLSINKTKTAALFIVFMMIASTVMLIVPAKGQASMSVPPISGPIPAGETAEVTVSPVAHLSFRPTRVGVGQEILINIWTTPATHAARYHPDYTVTIQDPDGEEEVFVMDSYPADATAWMPYFVDKVGEWQIKFDFLGTWFPESVLSGGFFGGRVNAPNTYYEPATTGWQTLIVQEEIVPSWPASPLPTDYWTRPVHVENREWWVISGNWPGQGFYGGGPYSETWEEMYPDTNIYWSERHRFTPWVQGPDSAHILWKRQDTIAGLIGGPAQQYGISSGPDYPDLIYAGRCYETYEKPGKDPQVYWRCYDLRTGEVYWEQTDIPTAGGGGFFFGGASYLVPNLIEYNPPTQSEVSGAEAAGTWSVNLMRIQSGRLYKWNPWTGEITTNASLSPISSATFYCNGRGRDTVPMALSVQNLGGGNYALINWTTQGSTSNFASRILTNTSYARSSLPTLADFETGYGATVSGITEYQVYKGMAMTGINLWTGETLWEKENSEPVYSFICDIVDHGKLAVLSAFGYYVCYDLRTGQELWKSESLAYPWSSSGFGAYSAMSAYGLIVSERYDGVYGINWTNGKIEWKYVAEAGSAYETPYTDDLGRTVMPFYSFGVGGYIADGKFFTWNYEHTETWPVTRGWQLHAIDMFTGEGVWELTGSAYPRAIADGYLIATNQYDGYMYVIGRGKSTMTVSCGPKAVSLGDQVVIEGTIMDMSPAQPGTPCVSEESMGTQMDYLHMQLPVGGIWGNITMTGVPVYLTALDANGNYQDLGVAISNAYTGTFTKSFEPPIPGDYEVIATFSGDASYGSSTASTGFTVGPAPTVAPTPEPVEIPDYTMLIYAVIIAVIIAIILGLVNLLLLMRK